MVRLVGVFAVLLVSALVFGGLGRSPTGGSQERTSSATDGAEYVLVGRITRIIDGDTIDVDLDSGPIRVRLDSIDAPERQQPWGRQAADALSRRVSDQEVELAVTEQDRYDRLVSTVYVDGENVNAWLVVQGHAWAYRAYLNDDSLLALEDEARRARRGLWSLADVVAPWDWRSEPSADFDDRDDFELPGPDAAAPTFECGTKRVCADMASCEEARFFLNQCGLSRLDGDNDGVPCEALCR